MFLLYSDLILMSTLYTNAMDRHLQTAEAFANLLDNQFSVFGIRFGANAVLDLVPEVGDFIAAMLSLYLIWIAVQMKVPFYRIAQMLFNIGLNFVIGLIPIIGDAAYIFRKANMKNLAILQKYR